MTIPGSLVSASEADTRDAGRRLAASLGGGELVILTGPLGAGKTVFVRGLAEGLGVDPAAVRSPTFVLHHVYTGGRLTLHHLDLYRLADDADLRVLDVDELLDAGDVVAVEWGERPGLRATAAWAVVIELDGDGRRISVEAGP